MTWAMDELSARAEGQLEALYGVQDAIGAVRVIEESDDKTVRVEVDGAGGLVGLNLSSTAARHGARALGQTIVETATRAAHRALQERAGITADFVEQFTALVGPHTPAPAATSHPSATPDTRS